MSPTSDLSAALEAAKGSNIQIGAENCHWAEKGAFTGEVSAKMLKAAGVPYVIIGHSERRQYFGETDVTVRNRVRAALNEGLKVILCVGEVLSERKDGITSQIVCAQTEIALGGVTAGGAQEHRPLPMSPSGLSARARPQLPSRPTRSAPLSALLSRDFTARTPRTQLLSSTAAR